MRVSWRTIEIVRIDGIPFAYQQKVYYDRKSTPNHPSEEHRLKPVSSTLSDDSMAEMVERI